MQKLLTYLQIIKGWLIRHAVIKKALYLSLLVVIAFSNTLHEKYPDEFDNLLGGRYLFEGKVIYRDFFTHHGPFPYFLTASLVPITGLSFVNIRLLYAALLIAVFIGYIYYARQKHSTLGTILTIFAPLWLVASVYFWGHMILADNLAAIAFIPVYLILCYTLFTGVRFRYRDTIMLSIAIAIALFSSLSYAFFGMLCYALISFLLIKHYKIQIKTLSFHALILAIPYLTFLAYLTLTGSLRDYYIQNIQFNSQYYVYNYPRPEGSNRINPLRYAVVITYNYIKNTHPLLTNIPKVDLYYPFNTTLALINASVIIFLLVKRKWGMAAIVFFTLAFVTPRSSPVDSGERDYQAAVYITISLLHAVTILTLLRKELQTTTFNATKITFAILFTLCATFSFFTSLFLVRKWLDFSYLKYMGQYPLIYDRPALAPIINATVEPDEYMWIGPFDFEDLFYAQGKLPSKYHILLPAMAKNSMASQLQNDIHAKRPKLIVFDWHLFILGNAPKDFAPEFLEYLNTNYIRLLDYREPDGTRYVSVQPIELRRDVEAKMYINPDYKDEVIADLLRANIIKID